MNIGTVKELRDELMCIPDEFIISVEDGELVAKSPDGDETIYINWCIEMDKFNLHEVQE